MLDLCAVARTARLAAEAATVIAIVEHVSCPTVEGTE
jgi:hypothetical protein